MLRIFCWTHIDFRTTHSDKQQTLASHAVYIKKRKRKLDKKQEKNMGTNKSAAVSYSLQKLYAKN